MTFISESLSSLLFVPFFSVFALLLLLVSFFFVAVVVVEVD